MAREFKKGSPPGAEMSGAVTVFGFPTGEREQGFPLGKVRNPGH